MLNAQHTKKQNNFSSTQNQSIPATSHSAAFHKESNSSEADSTQSPPRPFAPKANSTFKQTQTPSSNSSILKTPFVKKKPLSS